MQKILPAISNFKSLEKFLETDLEYCVIMNFSLIQLHRVCKLLRDSNKKYFVHMDLIKGIANNDFGCEYIIDMFKVHGVISTHPVVIEMAKKKNVIAIFRIFVIDSHSINKSLGIAKKCRPDYMEILPGFSSEIEVLIHSEIDTPLIGGGLINSKKLVQECLNNGLVAVTTSEISLWSDEIML